jgi:hypothetical protein
MWEDKAGKSDGKARAAGRTADGSGRIYIEVQGCACSQQSGLMCKGIKSSKNEKVRKRGLWHVLSQMSSFISVTGRNNKLMSRAGA